MVFDWSNRLHYHMEKEPDYALKTLLAYRLAMKAKDAIMGVGVRPAANSCEAARKLPGVMVYHRDPAPPLLLPGCPLAPYCGCLYRPLMIYQQADEG